MAWHVAPDHPTPPSASAGHVAPAAGHDLDDVLAPVVAGAYARGMADMLDQAQVPAVFLDGRGRVLFVNPQALGCLGSGKGLRIGASHLVAESSADNCALSLLVAAAVGDGAPHSEALALSGCGLKLQAVALPPDLPKTGQLLRGLILIDTGRDPVGAALIGRMAAMRAGGRRNA